MEPREKPKDPNDLKEYEPIPDGGKLLCAAVVLAALAALFTASAAFHHVRLGGLILCVALITMAVTRARDTARWLKAYWRRNVLGYTVAHFTENGKAYQSFAHCRVGEGLYEFTNRHPFVVLWPLGGWFHRPTVWWRGKRSWWSVTRDARLGGRLPATAKVTDAHGSSLRFGKLEDAMTFIAQRLERAGTRDSVHVSSDVPFNWVRLLEGLSEDRDDARRGRDEARAEAVRFVRDIAGELKHTDRLAHSIEGLRILERFYNWLCSAFEVMGDKYAQVEAQQGLALTRLELVEKQRRDRRRHGKPAAPAVSFEPSKSRGPPSDRRASSYFRI
jgi:hypothetical protein